VIKWADQQQLANVAAELRRALAQLGSERRMTGTKTSSLGCMEPRPRCRRKDDDGRADLPGKFLSATSEKRTSRIGDGRDAAALGLPAARAAGTGR
jgi:hypothetical protein